MRGAGRALRGQLDPVDCGGGVPGGEEEVEPEQAGGLGTGMGGEFR